MSSREILHILLLTHTQNEAENIVSLLRNSGSATRAQYVSSLAELKDQLQEKSWDLVITFSEINDVRYEDIIKLIKRLNKDLPLILLSNEEMTAARMEECIRKGASIMVPFDETSLLLLVIQRELRYLNARRELRALEVGLRDAEKRCQSLLENSRDAIAYVHDGMHVYANQAYLNLFGYQSTDELEGMPIIDMVASAAQQDFKQILKKLQQDSHQNLELKSTGVNGQGQAFPMLLNFAPATYGEEECTQVRINIDNSNCSELEERIKELSSRDSTTGLFNKSYLQARLEEASDAAVRKNAKGALLYINLNHFGSIKSEFGLNHSDNVLIHCANAIKACTQEGDILARAGEDIFTLLRMNCHSDDALNLAEKIRAKLEKLLIEADNRTITLTARIGVTLITESNSRPDDVLQQAMRACDNVRKEENNKDGNAVLLFTQDDPEQNQQDLEKVLVEAIRNNLFHLMFQPLISLQGEEAEHYETYLRLKISDSTEVSAGEFFSNPNISDDVKRKIDRWVIINTTKLLIERHSAGHNTRAFINLCAASLADESLPAWISMAMSTAKLPKGSLIFQFHEDDASRMLKQVQDFSHALQERGIPLSMSRYGCALNPMQILKRLAVAYVKVDGSFTQELNNSSAQKNLTEILKQLHEEDKITIVPLVENASSVATLWQMGAHFIQGYYLQAPQKSMLYEFNNDREM